MDEIYMQMALAEAQQAMAEDEVPVGTVIVYEDRVIAVGSQSARTIARSHGSCRDDRDYASGRIA